VVAGRPGCTDVVAGRTGSRPELYGVSVTVRQQSAHSFFRPAQHAGRGEGQPQEQLGPPTANAGKFTVAALTENE
jgi:hypothetical protein